MSTRNKLGMNVLDNTFANNTYTQHWKNIDRGLSNETKVNFSPFATHEFSGCKN